MATPYATIDTVQVLLDEASGPGLTIGPDSHPSESSVQLMLDQAGAEINAILKARGYATIPATGDDATMIGGYVTMIVAARVWNAAYGTPDDVPERITGWEEAWERFIDMLTDGRIVLMEQDPVSGDVTRKLRVQSMRLNLHVRRN